ncbi:hydroxymethylglutaryl-CoA lyase [Hymenobacter busanensis]|uniref:Hydroxymethylglutaryl-CoA lyase n=1 Tax=Hymenobacter busanensis TaxID=2607656 RepID=A0A7L4ZUM2_9BACT|nr:hydroxymethylglutaryl-CoA lyase [Hymenobacter busanensis]KAA9339730.1 hydroxymethylglutaryl-CoA lyase [Hymenobacter busanensis]QHJ06516.1 hydroxymethylglutaryl-CoA lyase [Hymenobacter busanensis]
MKLIECPRDAMQGWADFIPTETKTAYLNQLLRVGFDTLDFGSFVSPKAIPQLRDTAEVLAGLDLSQSATKLLAIVANLRGAETAVGYPEIQYLGFPLSVSETFQQRNTNKSIAEALTEVAQMQNLCAQRGKELVVYLSMGFGNPYGDPWNPAVLGEFTQKLDALGVRIVALSDTIGASTPETIIPPFRELTAAFPHIEFGAHLHTTPQSWREKVEAAYSAGCRRFDGALGGIGGCPMAADELTGNMATENLVQYFSEQGVPTGLNMAALRAAQMLSQQVFVGH